LLEASVDSVVLGCTHYPLLVPLLANLLPPHMRLIDPAVAVATQLDAFLGKPLPGSQNQPVSLEAAHICVTKDAQGFAERATAWLGQRPCVDLVNLQP
jgi:glutamate racemase